MPTRKKSVASSWRSVPKHSAVGRRLIEAVKEAAAYARGELALPRYDVTAPDQINVAAVRRALAG